jgi:hypothetical protein
MKNLEKIAEKLFSLICFLGAAIVVLYFSGKGDISVGVSEFKKLTTSLYDEIRQISRSDFGVSGRIFSLANPFTRCYEDEGLACIIVQENNITLLDIEYNKNNCISVGQLTNLLRSALDNNLVRDRDITYYKERLGELLSALKTYNYGDRIFLHYWGYILPPPNIVTNCEGKIFIAVTLVTNVGRFEFSLR